MFITVHFSAPMRVGDSYLIFDQYSTDGYPVSERVNIGNWQDVSQWCNLLRSYIDQAFTHTRLAASGSTSTRSGEILDLINQIRDRVLPEKLTQSLFCDEAVTLRPHGSFPKQIPWEAILTSSQVASAHGFTLDPGLPGAPRHVGAPAALLVLDPTRSFEDAAVLEHFNEVERVVAAAGLRPLTIHQADYGVLREQLMNPSLAMIYYFGHIDQASNGDGQFVLRNDTFLSATEIAQLIRPTATLVVLNGCSGAGSSTSLNRGEAINLAEAFGRSGAQFVTGAVQRIPWETAIAADRTLLFPFLGSTDTAAQVSAAQRVVSFSRFEDTLPDYLWLTCRTFARPDLTAQSILHADEPGNRNISRTWNRDIRPEIRTLTENVVDLGGLQQRIVWNIAPSLIEIAPRRFHDTASTNTRAAGEMEAYIDAFTERHPDADVKILVQDLLDQNVWDPSVTGLSAEDMRALLRVEYQLTEHGPLTADALRLVRRAVEQSFANGAHRLTNRAALTSLLAAPDSYLSQACRIDGGAHESILELLQGSMRNEAESASPQADSQVAAAWLACSGRLRSGDGQIDERALALGFCHSIDPGLKQVLSELPAPLSLDLDTACTELSTDSGAKIMFESHLSSTAKQYLQRAHGIACSLGQHPVSLSEFTQAYFGGDVAISDAEPLSYPLDDAAFDPLFKDALPWAIKRYGPIVDAAAILRAVWRHTDQAGRADPAVRRFADVSSVEAAMLLYPETDYLFECLDESSLLAATQGHDQVRTPHLYAALLSSDEKAFLQQLHIDPGDVAYLIAQLMRSVIPRNDLPGLTSGLSESVQARLSNYVDNHPDGVFEAGDFRFMLASPSHPVVESVLSAFQR